MTFDEFLFRVTGLLFVLVFIGYKANGNSITGITEHLWMLAIGFLMYGFIRGAGDTVEFIWNWVKGFF